MKLIARHSDVTASEMVVMLNRDDALKLGVDHTDRVRVTGGSTIICSVSITDSVAAPGIAVFPKNVMERCVLHDGDGVDVEYSPMPESVRSIRKKINGHRLDTEEINSIVWDIIGGGLSDKEILSFVSAFNVNNADLKEMADLTRAMAATGSRVDFGSDRVFDFHSLGGVPGNKITPIVVSIVASQDLVIPKLSSRAISSACGTSDFVDTFCDVEMDTATLIEAIKRAGGVFACGNEDYAPVGKTIIDTERPMGIDPRPMMLASIMSKKIAIGTTHLLIDIPMGKGAKIPDMETAEGFADDIIGLGEILGMHVECAVTYADQPLGRMIGPVLEAKECISVLEDPPNQSPVLDKACSMAGIILEMAGMKDGRARAEEILRSGEAHRKFLWIVESQNGDPGLTSDDMVPGPFVKDVHAKRDGYVQYIDNASMVAIAKGAGAPGDIGAGIEILHEKGDPVREGDALFRIYAENQAKLDRAVQSARSRRPMLVLENQVERAPSNMLLRRISKSS
jgi:AMP phosphorylase